MNTEPGTSNVGESKTVDDQASALAKEVEAMLSGSNAMSHGQLLLDPCMFNTKKVRESCIPSANGHFSARALAKVMATVGTGGKLIGSRRILSQESAHAMAKVKPTSSRALQCFIIVNDLIRRAQSSSMRFKTTSRGALAFESSRKSVYFNSTSGSVRSRTE